MFEIFQHKLEFKISEDQVPKWKQGVKNYLQKFPESKIKMDMDMTQDEPCLCIQSLGNDELFLLGLEIGILGGKFQR